MSDATLASVVWYQSKNPLCEFVALTPARVRHAAAAVLLAAALLSPAADAAEPATRSVLDGVYSQAQLVRGRTAYNRSCRKCHLNDLRGDALEPPLVTSLFLDAWREDYLFSLYDFIATRMPKGRDAQPGSLSEAEYVDIVAYIVAKNEFPAGQQELTRADVDTVLLVGPEGPQPLPPNAMVRTVGCLLNSHDGYKLSQAAAPARVRTGDETDAPEIALSVGTPAGTREFRLNNLDVLHAASTLEGFAGSRVQAKGVMNGEGATARIFVLSLVEAGEGCH